MSRGRKQHLSYQQYITALRAAWLMLSPLTLWLGRAGLQSPNRAPLTSPSLLMSLGALRLSSEVIRNSTHAK